jgi:hypothetical protein
MCQTQIQLTEQQKKVFFLLHLKQQKSTKIFPDFSATSKKRLALLFLEFSFLFSVLSLSVFYCDIEVVLSIKWLGGLVQARETREGHSVSAR